MTQRIPGGGSDLVPTSDIVGGSSVFVFRKKRRAKAPAKKPALRPKTANQNNLSRGRATAPKLLPPPSSQAAPSTEPISDEDRPCGEDTPVKVVIVKQPVAT